MRRAPLVALAALALLAPLCAHPPGTIRPLLHEQALSHLAFHSAALKRALAGLLPARAVAVVGVEWGDDVAHLADAGYHVYAFEPAAKFVAHLRRLVARNPAWNVTVVPVAAGNATRGTVRLEYPNEGVSETVPASTLDQHVHEELAVLSLDIQGDELHVLQGAPRTLREVGVHSVWVEAIACNDKVAEVLNMLDERYVIFDFVPWGKRNEDVSRDVPMDLKSFAFDPQRPGGFAEYLAWMCHEKEQRYRWLQTDFLAVRRDLMQEHVVRSLKSIADAHCGPEAGKANCVLRTLLLSNVDKDEL